MKKLALIISIMLVTCILVYASLYRPQIPMARDRSVSWVDSKGNLWLFGGIGSRRHDDLPGFLRKIDDAVRYNDLWKFDGSKWELVCGARKENLCGVYGIKGIAHKANIPGARFNSVSWIDSEDNLWLFGGYGYNSTGGFGPLHDLWKFDGTNWTWIGGTEIVNKRGVYGKKGVADTANVPGARQSASCWIDSNDNLWLFGGVGCNSNSDGLLNDLWKFDGINWIWVSGPDKVDQLPVYGTKGIADSANTPGTGAGGVSWIDSEDNLWLFGGNYHNDLWKFDGANWTWVSGSKAQRQASVYGTKGVADAANVPAARCVGAFCEDGNGNLWLFGGSDHKSVLNDLWKFDKTNWTWVSGSDMPDQKGVYGKKGVADPANIPGARVGCISWFDSKGNLWLFGGNGIDNTGNYGVFNDLWKFDGVNWTWVGGSKIVDQIKTYRV